MIKKFSFTEKNIFILLFVISFFSFSLKFIGGLRSDSIALVNHSYDMLIDAIVSALSLFAIRKTKEFQENLALFKGLMLGSFGLISLYSLFEKLSGKYEPIAEEILTYGSYSILLNIISISFIYRSRKNSLLLKSSWLACKMDFLVNLFFLASGFTIDLFKSNIPDLIMSLIISFLFIKAFFDVFLEWKSIKKPFIEKTV